MPYDPVGSLNGLFAPAYQHGNKESEDAVAKWQAENFAVTPDMIEATRGPDVITHNPAVGGQGQMIRGFGSTAITPGSVDPDILKVYAQGGHYNSDHAFGGFGAGDMGSKAGNAAAAAPAPVPVAGPAGRFGLGSRDAIALQMMLGRGGGGYGNLLSAGNGVYLPPTAGDGGGGIGRIGYPWGQNGPDVTS